MLCKCNNSSLADIDYNNNHKQQQQQCQCSYTFTYTYTNKFSYYKCKLSPATYRQQVMVILLLRGAWLIFLQGYPKTLLESMFSPGSMEYLSEGKMFLVPAAKFFKFSFVRSPKADWRHLSLVAITTSLFMIPWQVWRKACPTFALLLFLRCLFISLFFVLFFVSDCTLS